MSNPQENYDFNAADIFADDVEQASSEGENVEQVESTPETPETPAQTPTPASTKPVTLEDLKSIFQGSQQQQSQAAQQAPAPAESKYTPEQIKQALNPFSVTPAVFTELFNAETPEQGIKALNTLVQGIQLNAQRQATALVLYELQKLRQEYQPYVEMAQTTREQQLRADYHGKFPHHEQYPKLVEQVLTAMSNQRQQFSNTAEFHTALGNAVEALLTELKIAPTKPLSSQQQQPVGKRPNKSLMTGRTASNASAATGSNPQTQAMAIFGK